MGNLGGPEAKKIVQKNSIFYLVFTCCPMSGHTLMHKIITDNKKQFLHVDMEQTIECSRARVNQNFHR